MRRGRCHRKAASLQPDLVLLDLVMPNVSGTTALGETA